MSNMTYSTATLSRLWTDIHLLCMSFVINEPCKCLRGRDKGPPASTNPHSEKTMYLPARLDMFKAEAH